MKKIALFLTVILTVCPVLIISLRAQTTYQQCEDACAATYGGQLADAEQSYGNSTASCDEQFNQLESEVESNDVANQIAIEQAYGDCLNDATAAADASSESIYDAWADCGNGCQP